MISTAGTPESRQWVLDHGAHEVVDHRDLVAQVPSVRPDGVGTTSFPRTRVPAIFAEILPGWRRSPRWTNLRGWDLLPLKDKSITFHWEYMFTRPQLLKSPGRT